ncbi:MAG: hypothetical protein JWO51_2754 [Rhodospirillales bacterium]|nr:hypothetical protein [Rhodospirillales bacterium]
MAGGAGFGAVRTAWVLDGATGIGGRNYVSEGPSDAAWLARALSDGLSTLDPGERSPRDHFAEVIGRVADRYRRLVPDHVALPPYALPSAAGIWLRAAGDRLDLAHQGDCVAVVEQGAAIRVFGTVDQTGLDDIHNLVTARQAAGPVPGKLLDVLGDALRDRRSRLNQPGGYWMLGIEPRAAAAMAVERLAPLAGTRVLLCSDGYWRLVDHFRRYDAHGLLKASFERGPDALLDELRALEAADPDCLAFPRIKPMDDATALILRF